MDTPFSDERDVSYVSDLREKGVDLFEKRSKLFASVSGKGYFSKKKASGMSCMSNVVISD